MKEKILALLREVKRDGMESLIEWLEKSDYFRAPASAEYHLNYEGGLIEHSLSVFNVLEGIVKKYSPETPRDSIIICGLLHDACKINCYVKDKRNKKIDGKWVEQPYWNFVEEVPLLHGHKSVILLQEHIKLTRDEQFSIAHHMAAWDSETVNQRRTLNNAINKCRLLKCLILADNISTWLIEEDKK